MHRRGVVCNGIDDFWGLLRWRRIGMRLSEVCAQGRRSPAGAHTLRRVPRGSVTVRMYMSTPLWMREGTSLSPPFFTGTFLQREPLARAAYIVLVRGILYLTTVPLILSTDPQCTARHAVWPCAALAGKLTVLSTKERLTVLLSVKERLGLLSTGERLVLLSTGERLGFACCNALGS